MIKIPLLKDANLKTKVYDYFRGVDFTTDPAELDDSRSPDALNMVADDAGFPEKRVGWRIMHQLTGPINGLIYVQFPGDSRKLIAVHHGTSLSFYAFETDTLIPINVTMANTKSAMFLHGGKLYVMDGSKFMRFYFNGSTYITERVKDHAKTPTTGRGGHYEAEVVEEGGVETTVYTWVPCTAHEEPNLLSSSQINLFAGDGVNKVFWLTERGATVTKVEQYSGSAWSVVASTAYTVAEDTTAGKTKITFTNAPVAHPNGAGLDDIRVTFTSTEHPESASLIDRCSIATPYGYFNDNRIFVAGNPDHKNRDWACAIDDPTYWELNQWTDVGSDHTSIMGYLHYGDVLAIIKEDDNQDAEIYIRSATVQSDNSIIYPVQQGVKGVGAISRGGFATLHDDALFYAREGVFAVAGTDASQQRTVQNRSYFVDNKLAKEFNKESAVAVAWGDLLLLAFPGSGHCYVADARQKTPLNFGYVYEWFFWDNIPARVFLEFDGNLYFGTTDGALCRFNDDFASNIKYMDGLTRFYGDNPNKLWHDGAPIRGRWSTKADALGALARFKTLTKRGCTCVLKPISGSNVDISVITDRSTIVNAHSTNLGGWDFGDVDFANIDFGGMGTPQIIALNSKVRRFKMVQLKFENAYENESFGVCGVQLQYTVNNYIK